MAILSEETGSLLMFLGFRHVVRQVYGFELDEKRLESLSVHFEPVFGKVYKRDRRLLPIFKGAG
ncbi:MAG: hypothetical protein HUU08_11905 [Candidatus Brocadia sp.]|nr:hypothetical protein [Candidatus Brocadia sp.]